jgi:PAS domain S-box-containing protein
MAISRDITGRIKDLLKDHPRGLSITDIVKVIPINRNTASRYLDTLLVSGQVEMRHFGMAKLYSLSHRLPVSSVLAISSEYVIQLDRNLRIIFLNAPFLHLLEVGEAEIVGKKIDYTQIPALFDEEYSRLLRWISEGLSGVERRGELRLVAKGKIFTCRVTPSVFAEGQKGVSVLLEDITAQRRDEVRLRESEERYRTLVEISPDAIILHRNGALLYVNPAAVRMFGASVAGDLLERNILDLVAPEHRAAVLRNIRYDLKGEETPLMELEMRRIDGTPITIEGRGVRTFLEGEPAVQVAMRDITGRKRAETALQKSESHLRSIIRATPIGIGIVAGRVLREVNDQMCGITGYPAGELVGQSVRILYPSEEEYDRVGIEAYRSIAGEGIGSAETVWKRKNGEMIDVLISLTPLNPSEPGGDLVFTALDITQRKNTERAILASEERYRHLLEGSFDAVIVHKDGKIIVANDAALALGGATSPQEIVGQEIGRFIHPASRQLVGERIAEMLRTPGTVMPIARETFLRLNGEPFNVEVMATSFSESGIPAIQIIFREITEITRMEERLKKSEEIYRTLAESAADMIYIVNPNGDLVYANTLCARIFGCSPAELVGRKQTDLFPQEIAEEHLACIRRVVTTGMPFEHEEAIPTPAGILRIDIKLSPIFSHDGTVVSVVGIARDMTARKSPGA